MSKKQITLLETWNKTLSQGTDRNLRGADRNASSPVQLFRSPNEASTSVSSPNLFQSLGYSKKTNELVDPEFDYEAGKTWIYPTNYPVRDYQFSIVKEALFKNTLVVLPTGLGKTFIAAVVMYNIYRWFPDGKVVFMAPTKPLVAQQIDACFNITGIPYEDTTQMTGTNAPELRKRMWQKKRVFFLTPQVLVNDLVRNICPASSIKCLVVDEAHKALGNHAYCQVIKELSTYTSHFRVLALTATPGSETQAVKQVLTNLLISHVEMRSEDSADVQQYTHVRDIEKIVVPLGDRLNALKSRFLDVINIYLKRLTLRNVISTKNPSSLSKFQVLKLREAFSQNPPSNIDRATYGLAMADFSLLISLYHAYELLLLHGATTFYNFLLGILNGDKSIPHARAELLRNFEFGEIMENVKATYIPEPLDKTAVQNGQMNIKKKRVMPGHPKLDKLVEIVLEHFRLANFENLIETRVMIFTQYRDSVQEIVDLLNQYQPTIKVMNFIGQAAKSGTSAGFSQKQQLKVLQQFRSGGYNTLVSTCVGEEGLDIGEVDLIVCYDCPKSPIRQVQRMGRTGRLRKGRIVLLIAEGKEEQMYNTCEHRKKAVHRAISKGFAFAQFYQDAPSLLPPNVLPQCVKAAITIKEKKPEPKVKVTSKSPFLNDEEMAEFNLHVKIPQSDVPLLPKREFVVLKNQEATSALVEHQLSLHEWTLWQTTPQRTDMIPHSSKSLLLVRTLEHIHFPEILNSKLSSKVPDFTNSSFLNISANHSKSNKRSRFSSRQSKITDCLYASKNVVDDENDFAGEDDVVEIYPSPEREADRVDFPFILAEVDGSLSKKPLIERLLNVEVPNYFGEIDAGNIKPPPVLNVSLSIEDFNNADIKNVSGIQSKSSSILCILNKKMKARIKRKKKELFISKDSQPTLSPPCDVNTVKEDYSCFGKSADINAEISIKEQKNDQDDLEGVVFDIDFDIPDVFENSVNFDEDLHFNNFSNADTKKENKLKDGEKHLMSPNFSDCLQKENKANFEQSADSNDDHDLHKAGQLLNKNSGIIKSSAPSDVITYEKKISSALDKPAFHENATNSLNAKIVNQNNSVKFSTDLVSENDCPSSISFDINFFDDEDDDLLNFNNDIPTKDSDNLSSKAKKVNAVDVNTVKNNNIGKNTMISDKLDKYLVSNDCEKEKLSGDLTVCEEKQSSVLKDVKNIHHLSDHEKSVEQRNKLHFKSSLNDITDNYKMRHLQTLGNADKNNSDRLNDKKLIPSSVENKDDIMDSSECPSKNEKLHDISKTDDFEEAKFQRHNAFESAFSTLHNANNMQNNSLNNCNNSKLLPKEGNDKHFNVRHGKYTFKNIKSMDPRYTNVSPLPGSNIIPQDMRKVKNSVECNFDFDVSFANNDLEIKDDSASKRPDLSSESTKIYSFSKNGNFDFDVSFANNDLKIKDDSSSKKPDMSSESTKMYSFSKNGDIDDDGLDEFKDANSIFEQLFSSQKNVSSELNSSFSSLTVKRCISETGAKEGNKNRKRLCRRFDRSSTNPSNSFAGEKSKLTDVFKIPSVTNANSFNSASKINSNASNMINSPQGNLNKTAGMAEDASQYSLTQLLSFINCSESIEKSYMEKSLMKSPKNLQNTPKFSDSSSEDEVCPTPPKKIIKPNTEFIYNKNSAVGKSLDFKNCEGSDTHIARQKHSGIVQDALNSVKTREKTHESASFDSADGTEQRNVKSSCSTDFAAVIGNGIEVENIKDELSPKITFDVSFDLPFTQDEFEQSRKDDMNNAMLIESSSSEEKLIPSQNDGVEFSKSIWNKNRKTDFVPEVSSNDSGKKNSEYLSRFPNGDEVPDDLIEDSESLLPSKPIQNYDFATLNGNLPEQPIVSNFTIQNLKSVNDATEIYTQNVKKNSGNNFKMPANSEDKLPQNDEENFEDFESSIFYKLLSPENNAATNREAPVVLNDLKSKKTENDYNPQNSYSLLCKTNKNSQEVDKNNFNSNILSTDTDNHLLKSMENCNEINVLHSVTENEFKNAKKVLEEKTFHELTDLQNVSVINKDLKQHTDECSEEKLCFDLTFDDETCDLLPFENNPINCNENEPVKNSAIFDKSISSKSAIESETKSEFKNITKKSIFKKTEIKSAVSSDTNFTKLNEVDVKQKKGFNYKNDKSNLTAFQDSTVHNGEESALYNFTNNNSSDEFDLQDQNRTAKTKILPNERPKKNSETRCSKQDVNIPKNKLTSKLSKKKGVGKGVLKNNAAIEDEEEDFQFIQKIEKKTNNPAVKKRTKRKRLSDKNEFLLSQAEVSGSDHESDYDSDEDAINESFITDESPIRMNDTDQHAFYLKSVKECAGLPQKFKLKPLANHNFITEPAEGYSNYEYDSFCVNDEEIVFLSSEEDMEDNEYRHDKPKLSKKYKDSKKKLKRVITHDSSSSSENETSPKFRKCNNDASYRNGIPNNSHDESVICVRKPKSKRVLVSSDEDDDYAFVKPAIPDHNKKNGNASVDLNNASVSSEKVPNVTDDEKLVFSIDFDDDIEFLDEINSPTDKTLPQKPKISNKDVLNNIEADTSLCKPTISKHEETSSSVVKVAGTSATDRTIPQKPKITNKNIFNTFEAGISLCKPTISKKEEPSTSAVKDTGISAVDEVTDISFDISWHETCPSNVRTSIINDNTVPSLLNESTSSNLTVIDTKDVASVILVDSRELASGKPVISSLRNKHKINPAVMQLTASDYIISNRIAVERVLDSEFSNCSMPPKIVEKIKDMIGMYEKSVVIIEKDSRKSVLSFNKNVTKYLQFVIHLNYLPQVKVLFSKSADHTSDLIANLIQQERKRGFHINVPVTLNPNNQKLFDFYSSLPKISPICALNFMYYFPTIEQLLKSSVGDLKKKGCISSQKAVDLYKYFRNQLTFNEKL